jgi:large subunit ribosomal protein L6
MSRIGKMPIEVVSGATLTIDGNHVTAKGRVGELQLDLPEILSVKLDGSLCTVERNTETREARSLHGLFRSLVANMIEGVSKGFRKDLQIEGVGYRAQIQGQKLTMTVGYSNPVVYVAPDGVTLGEEGGTKISITGADKQKVGQTAARIRAFAPAEPYKGKGLSYKGERIRRKVGKTVA